MRARVLARQSDRAIAQAVGLLVAAVASYVGLFFDVRDRINARSYVRWQVAGFGPGQPPGPETLMLLNAYHHGPCVIPAWLDYFAHAGERHDLATEEGRNRTAIELLIEVRQLPNDAEIRQSLGEKLGLILLKPPKISKTVSIKAQVSQNVTRMLGRIVWQSARNEAGDTQRSNVDKREKPEIIQFRKTG